MRSFQVMRYGRRPTPTKNELAQSIFQAGNLTAATRRRSSTLVFGDEHRQNSYQYDENDNENSILQRRNTLTVQKPLTTLDGIDLSRRSSYNNGRRLSFQQQEIIETSKSKSKTNLRNFYIFFVLLFLFIFIAVVYSFIRMIKNQVS